MTFSLGVPCGVLGTRKWIWGETKWRNRNKVEDREWFPDGGTAPDQCPGLQTSGLAAPGRALHFIKQAGVGWRNSVQYFLQLFLSLVCI